MSFGKLMLHLKGYFMYLPGESGSPVRYISMRRNIIVLMILVTLIPLTLMAFINYHQYQTSLKNELIHPLRLLTSKTKHSFELFLEERASTIRALASSYSFEDFSGEQTINRIYRVLKKEFTGFVDLGLISEEGVMLNYAGPYDLRGINFSSEPWFQEVMVRGVCCSNIVQGGWEYPHIIISALQLPENGPAWILRASMDTQPFSTMISAIGLGPESDAFLVNKTGILQTNTKFYGSVMETVTLSIPSGGQEARVLETADQRGREILLAYAHFAKSDYTLVIIRPRGVLMEPWFVLQSEMLLVFVFGIALIILVSIKLSDTLVQRIRDADEKRETAFRELEYSHKLSSIGRLAAGVAHEVNNPLAIINEKVGLIRDLIECANDDLDLDQAVENPSALINEPDCKIYSLTDEILNSVVRCKTITHRLLGFARRMEVTTQSLDLNELLREVWGYLDKEALYKKVSVDFRMAEEGMMIESDRGQLQQVFFNIFTNALEAVEEHGSIVLSTWEENPETVGISIQDDGEGISPENLERIFDPFFSTRQKYGTGLGLSITYGIIKKLGGEIQVQSTLGEGSKFTVHLLKQSRPKGGE